MPGIPDLRALAQNQKFALLMTFTATAVIMIVFASFLLTFRDTWEAKNHAKIVGLCDEAQRTMKLGNDEQSLVACEDVFSFIGKHKLIDESLTARTTKLRESQTELLARIQLTRENREREKAKALAEEKRLAAKLVETERNAQTEQKLQIEKKRESEKPSVPT